MYKVKVLTFFTFGYYMTVSLEIKFAQKIEHFFKKRQISFESVNSKQLTAHLYKQFQQQGRFKDKSDRFYVTPKLVFEGIIDFLKISHENGMALFRQLKESRASMDARGLLMTPLHKKNSSGGLIHLMGRKNKPKFKFTQPDGTQLTPRRLEKIKAKTSHFDVSFSPVVPTHPGKSAREGAESSSGSLFEQDMTSSSMTLWREKTPSRSSLFSPHRVVIAPPREESKKVCKQLDFSYDVVTKKDTTELFDFTVTQEEILSRMGAKRPCSQKSVWGNVTALEVMEAVGVVITEKQNGRSFHWAHRRGWSLHGEQKRENLDPMTAGSNYDTLFKVEAPLKKLLFEDKLSEIFVNGTINFDKDYGLPRKITYRLSWGTTSFIEIVIDPMSHRIPTVDEHEIAKTFFGIERSFVP